MNASASIAIDTNVLVYAEGLGDLPRITKARLLIERLRTRRLVMPLQVAFEFLQVLIRKEKIPRERAVRSLATWQETLRVVSPSPDVIPAAVELVEHHQLQIFDAAILATAHLAGASLLVSEDMADGFSWRGVTVVNPFATPLHPTLQESLDALDPSS